MGREGWLGLLFILTWILWMSALGMVTGRASTAFREQVTVPHCHEACRAAGAGFERFRIHTKNGPAEACVCEGGVTRTPAFLKSSTPPELAAISAMIAGGIAGMIGLARVHGWLQRRRERR